MKKYDTDETWYINASSKLLSLEEVYAACNEEVYIDTLYYYGFDKIDQHETSAYMQMKQVKAYQEESDMKRLYEKSFEYIQKLLDHKHIDTIAVIPNNVSRQRSFNEYIYHRVTQGFPILNSLEFIKNNYPGKQPQKTIRDICKRLENAENLFDIWKKPDTPPTHILLIDDVVWSWATMNMMSKKIKHIYPDVHITWFAILWSYRKGFDIVNEV